MNISKQLALSAWILFVVYFICNSAATILDFLMYVSFALLIIIFIISIVYLVMVVQRHKNHPHYKTIRAAGIVSITNFTLNVIFYIVTVLLGVTNGIASWGILASSMLVILILGMGIVGLTITSFIMYIVAWSKLKNNNQQFPPDFQIQNFNFNNMNQFPPF